MSSHAASRVARRRPRARIRRRRLAAVAVVALLGVVCAALVAGLGEPLVREITLPLKHDDIIRQQAADKGLDPALIAAVIYEESRFRDQTSHAGARGLMQITPDTADFIARHSGGYRFKQSDLATPQINIAYGSYYLRYLMDHYEEARRSQSRPTTRASATWTDGSRRPAAPPSSGRPSTSPFPRRAPTWRTSGPPGRVPRELRGRPRALSSAQQRAGQVGA